jgi:hypothetical protein
VAKEQGRVFLADALPEAITDFLELFEDLDIRQQKAHLQDILKPAKVYRDNSLELEFRE